MTITVGLVLLIVAFVMFLFAALNVPSRFNWVPLGLAFWVLAVILGFGPIVIR